MQQTSAEDYLDRAAQAAIMVCMACNKPTPPGGYTFKSNAWGENLGGIFCSESCCDSMQTCDGEFQGCGGSGVTYVMENGGPERKETCGYCGGSGFTAKPQPNKDSLEPTSESVGGGGPPPASRKAMSRSRSKEETKQ